MSRCTTRKPINGLIILLIIVGTSAISAQVQAPDLTVPAFDVVSIKLNHAGGRPSMRSSPGGRTTATNQTLKSLIQWAYDVQGYQISGGPKWIDSVGYDIEATPKVALNPGPDTIRYFGQQIEDLRWEPDSTWCFSTQRKSSPRTPWWWAKGAPN